MPSFQDILDESGADRKAELLMTAEALTALAANPAAMMSLLLFVNDGRIEITSAQFEAWCDDEDNSAPVLAYDELTESLMLLSQSSIQSDDRSLWVNGP